jgi:Fe2+ or Zn2+ uptake regulation protein
MKTVPELTTRFRDQGLRMTPQRQAVFSLLQDNELHPTVEALYDAVRRDMPTISLKTVYQIVHELAALGEVELIDVGTGSVRVDPNVERPHHHLICSRCGKVRDVNVELETLRLAPRQRQGFAVSSIEVNFRGLCEECTANE